MAILSILLTVLIVAASVLMILIVLIQRPKQEGLGAAFGGGTLDSALGAHTTDVLQKATTWIAIVFFVSAIGLAMVKTRQYKASPAKDLLESVENRETATPALPPSISDLPVSPVPVTEGEKGDSDAPAPAAKEEAPKSAAPKEKAAPKADSSEGAKAAPKAKETAPVAPAAKEEAPKAGE